MKTEEDNSAIINIYSTKSVEELDEDLVRIYSNSERKQNQFDLLQSQSQEMNK